MINGLQPGQLLSSCRVVIEPLMAKIPRKRYTYRYVPQWGCSPRPQDINTDSVDRRPATGCATDTYMYIRYMQKNVNFEPAVTVVGLSRDCKANPLRNSRHFWVVR